MVGIGLIFSSFLRGRNRRRSLRRGVHTLVHFEIARVRVALPALVTYVLFASSVDVALVCAEVAALAEALPADLAAVWLLARVSSLVQL